MITLEHINAIDAAITAAEEDYPQDVYKFIVSRDEIRIIKRDSEAYLTTYYIRSKSYSEPAARRVR